ncbi:MAG: DUF1801 domain-containing protein [Anaerolineales bacterium]
MAELKTKKNQASVESFLKRIPDPVQREDSRAVLRMMKDITRLEPKMWGTSIIGFGDYHYKYATGREGDTFLTGFSPRKGTLTLYIGQGFEAHAPLMKKLGTHKTGVGCLYIKKLDDVDLPTLRQLVRASVARMKSLRLKSHRDRAG